MPDPIRPRRDPLSPTTAGGDTGKLTPARVVGRPPGDGPDPIRRQRPDPRPAWLVPGAGLAGLAVLVVLVRFGLWAADRQRAEARQREAEAAVGWKLAAGRGAHRAGEPRGAAEPRAADTVRELDKAAGDEVRAAFEDNPAAARQRYARVRFRFRIEGAIVHDDLTATTVPGNSSVKFRSPEETVKLHARRPARIEAVITHYPEQIGEQMAFEDATVLPD